MTQAQVAALNWNVWPAPLIGPPPPSPIIADPTFLPPEETQDGSWRLWAHSMFGLLAYTSADGFDWRKLGTVTRNALRAQILSPTNGLLTGYRLTYEKSRLFLPMGVRWSSWIETRTSGDLNHWSDPSVLVRPSPPWHSDSKLGDSISNPYLVRVGERWRLYFSAGLTLVPDCGFPEPTYIGVAEADSPAGPFTLVSEPILGPGDGPANLAAGALKVLQVADGWVGFQNAITWDGRRSASAIWVLGSSDGLNWVPLADEPALAPGGQHWRSTHVYALDARDTALGPRMYFNARDGYHWSRGRERIGVAMPDRPRVQAVRGPQG